jgi:regulator of cell morphogenesis and NO signaling
MEPGHEEEAMSVTAEKTVRELTLENSAATRVFEKLGIDYCCGGNKSLEEAWRTANLPMDEVLDSLELAEKESRANQKERDWQVEALADIIAHISTTHHRYTREGIARWARCSTRSIRCMARTILNCSRSAPAFRDSLRNSPRT